MKMGVCGHSQIIEGGYTMFTIKNGKIHVTDPEKWKAMERLLEKVKNAKFKTMKPGKMKFPKILPRKTYTIRIKITKSDQNDSIP